MPKDFDRTKIGFSSGILGSVIGYEKVDYFVEGNTISGKYTDSLQPREALTIRLQLPEGYFNYEKNVMNLYSLTSIATILISIIISLFLWINRGRQDEIVDIVEFYPPNDYNSLDIAFYYKGEANNYDIISLLIYLGNKSYLSIEELKKKTMFSKKNDFLIHKIKEYDGNNESEKIFYNGFFEKGDIVSGEDLKDKFYKTILPINKIINSKNNRNKIFTKKRTHRFLISSLMLLTVFVVFALPLYDYYEGLIPVAIIIIVILFLIQFMTPVKRAGRYSIFNIVLGLIFGVAMTAALYIFGLQLILMFNTSYVYIFSSGLVSLIIMNIFRNNLIIRTPFGAEIYGRIKGFKNFIEYAEKDRIQTLIEDKPQYFYHIIPYAYVLGVSKKWIKRFESLDIKEPPNFYYGNSSFDHSSFNSFMDNTVSSVYDTISYSSSSGGSSSGGGSGGGGGSSW